MNLTAAARAVWEQDIKLANYIIKKGTGAQHYIFIANGQVLISDVSEFNKQSDKYKLEQLEKRKADTIAEFETHPKNPANKKKVTAKVQAILRLAKLWLPFGRTLQLAGVSIDGVIFTGIDMRKQLHVGWRPTFAYKSIDTEGAKTFLSRFAVPFDWSELDEFELDSFILFLKSVPHSAPGPDGIPYYVRLESLRARWRQNTVTVLQVAFSW